MTVVIAAVYAAAPYLIESVLLRQLEQQGFESISIRAERPRWDTLELSWLSFESRQGNIKWLLEARSSRVKINPLKLFSGDLPKLSIAQAYLEIDSRGRRENIEPSDIELVFPVELISLIPLRSLVVEHLSVSWRGQSQSSLYEGSAFVDRLADRVQLEISLAKDDGAQKIPYTAGLLLTRSGQVVLSLSAQEGAKEPLLTLKARLSERNESVEISKGGLLVDAQRLNSFGKEFGLFEPINVESSGYITVNFQGHLDKKIVAGLPKKYRLHGDVRTEFNSVLMPAYAYEGVLSLHASFDIDHVSTAVTLDEKSRVQIVPPQALIAFANDSPQLLPLERDMPIIITVKDALNFNADLSLDKLAGLQQWAVEGVIEASLPLVKGRHWQLTLDSPSLSIDDVIALNAAYRLKLPIDQFNFDEGYVAESVITLNGVLNARSDQVNASIIEGSSWSSNEAHYAEQKLDSPKLNVSKLIAVNYDIIQGRWQFNDAQFELTGSPLVFDEYSFTPSPIYVDIDQALGLGDKWNVSGSVLAEVIAANKALVSSAGDGLTLYASAKFKVDNEALLGTNALALDSESNTVATGEFFYDWGSATGGMTWQVSALPVKDWQDVLPVLIPALGSQDIQLSDGSLDAHISFFLLDKTNRAKASLRLTGLAGNYGTVQAKGVSAHVVIDDLLALTSKKKNAISVDELDIGFPVKNIRFNVQPVSKEDGSVEFIVSDASAQLLGGEAALDRMAWQPDQKSEFVVDVSGVDLGEILALERQPGLSGSGMIDGRIPITLAGGVLSVTTGTLQARQPGGVLSYHSDAAANFAKSNPALGLALNALEDFRYDSLTAKVNYRPNGEMVLALSIVGHNPDFENGRQINLNINVEENVKTLLQSLQLAGDLTDKIDERVQQRLKPRLKPNADN